MKEFMNSNDEPYSKKYMKLKLEEYFGEDVVIAEINGINDVVTLKLKANKILQDFYKTQRCENEEEEKTRLIIAAAKIIKSDIKSIFISKNYYPKSSEISVEESINYLPESRKHFLELIFVGQNYRKVAAVGQAIMQAARPRAIIAPLQLGLGLQMHHHFASKFLIETLNNLGFSSSYSEVMLYKRNAAVTADPNNNTLSCGQFMQYIADNIDHNLRTIDGKNTFHGMGIISCITPEHKEIRTIARKTNVSLAEIVDLSHVNIKFYSPQNTHIDDVKFTYLPDPKKDINSCNIDLLWNVSWLLRPNTPLWSGAMQLIQKVVYPGKSTITFFTND